MDATAQLRTNIVSGVERRRRGLMKNLGLLVAVRASAAFFALDDVNAEESTLPPDTSALNSSRRLFIDPSSTLVKLGKARLIVTPLTPRDNTYVGDYRLKVVPYFFKSEKGRLLLAAPKDSYRRLNAGAAVEFTGVATNEKNGETKIVRGKITPLTRDRCNVVFSVLTDNGKMVFNTSYHFAP
jgi:hypothetical protein